MIFPGNSDFTISIKMKNCHKGKSAQRYWCCLEHPSFIGGFRQSKLSSPCEGARSKPFYAENWFGASGPLASAWGRVQQGIPELYSKHIIISLAQIIKGENWLEQKYPHICMVPYLDICRLKVTNICL